MAGTPRQRTEWSGNRPKATSPSVTRTQAQETSPRSESDFSEHRGWSLFSPASLMRVRRIFGITQGRNFVDRRNAIVAVCSDVGSDQNLMALASRAGRSMHASFPVLAGRKERCAGEAGWPGSQSRHHPRGVVGSQVFCIFFFFFFFFFFFKKKKKIDSPDVLAKSFPQCLIRSTQTGNLVASPSPRFVSC